MSKKKSILTAISAVLLLGAAPQAANAWISGAIVGGVSGAVSGAVSGGATGAAVGGAGNGIVGGAVGGASGAALGGVNGALSGAAVGLLNPIPFVPIGSTLAGGTTGALAGTATGAVTGGIAGVGTNIPLIAGDRAKWDLQDTAEGAAKMKGAWGDNKKGLLGFPGVLGRKGQILVETAEQIAHDRTISTKGYTDRAVTEGIKTAENNIQRNSLGDLNAVAKEMGVTGTGGGKWRTNGSGQIIDSEGKVIRPHEVVNNWEAKGFKGKDLSALKAVDGYFTQDKNGNLVAHNLTGGTIIAPNGMIDAAIKGTSATAAQITSDIANGLNSAWAKGDAGQKKVYEWLNKHSWPITIDKDGVISDFNHKVIGKIQDLNTKGSDAAKWLDAQVQAALEATDPLAKGWEKGDNATVADIARKQNENIAKNAQSITDNVNALNQRFDTTIEQGKAYVDATAQQTLKSANDYTDSRYNELNGKVKKLRARADSGIAGATAIASLPFSEAGKNSLAGGLGVAKNKVAGAVGFQHNFDNSWRARATVSVSDNYVQGGAGVGMSW